MSIPDDCLCRARIDVISQIPASSSSQQACADAVDQDRGDDDHADQSLLPVGVDLRQHQPVSDDLEQDAADDGAERATEAAGEIGAADPSQPEMMMPCSPAASAPTT